MFKRTTAVLLSVICALAVMSIPAYAKPVVSVRTEASAGAYSGRNRLLKQERGEAYARIYDTLVQGITAFAGSISTVDEAVTKAELEVIMKAMLADHPEMIWYDGIYAYFGTDPKGNIRSIFPSYTTGGDELTLRLSALDASVEKYLAGVDDTISEYDRAKVIHDRIVANVQYDSAPSNADTVYGALVEGRALCSGYAKAYQYLLRKVGIEAELVYGTAGGIKHAWLLVKLDGEYYYSDVTWDDPLDTDDDDNTIDSLPLRVINYAYFNATTEQLKKTHIIEDEALYPICTATAASYYTKNGAVLSSFDVDTVAELLKAGGGVAQIYTATDELNASFCDDFFANIEGIAKKLGVYGSLSAGMSGTGYEVIPYIVTAGTSILSGEITGFENGPFTVTLTAAGADTPAYTVTAEKNYVISGIAAGEYTLRVVSENGLYATETVTLGLSEVETLNVFVTRYGDVNFDGDVDLTDLLRLKLVAAGIKSEYNPDGFDVSSDKLAEKLVELQRMLLEP